jgi:hypothetical protein
MKSRAMRIVLSLLEMTNWKGSLLLAPACALFMALAASPSHAQFAYTDVFDMNCNRVVNGACDGFNIGQLQLWTDGNLYGTAFPPTF